MVRVKTSGGTDVLCLPEYLTCERSFTLYTIGDGTTTLGVL